MFLWAFGIALTLIATLLQRLLGRPFSILKRVFRRFHGKLGLIQAGAAWTFLRQSKSPAERSHSSAARLTHGKSSEAGLWADKPSSEAWAKPSLQSAWADPIRDSRRVSQQTANRAIPGADCHAAAETTEAGGQAPLTLRHIHTVAICFVVKHALDTGKWRWGGIGCAGSFVSRVMELCVSFAAALRSATTERPSKWKYSSRISIPSFCS